MARRSIQWTHQHLLMRRSRWGVFREGLRQIDGFSRQDFSAIFCVQGSSHRTCAISQGPITATPFEANTAPNRHLYSCRHNCRHICELYTTRLFTPDSKKLSEFATQMVDNMILGDTIRNAMRHYASMRPSATTTVW
jgi:hypothetical protein